jgi:hypothetical protein
MKTSTAHVIATADVIDRLRRALTIAAESSSYPGLSDHMRAVRRSDAIETLVMMLIEDLERASADR